MPDTSKRIIVAGVGPIPPARADKTYAPGLRLWVLADQLERRGYEVVLCEAMFAGSSPVPGNREAAFKDRRFIHEFLPLGPREAAQVLRRIAEQHAPIHAVVSSTDVINCAVATASLPVPCLFDYLGHPMAERQMQARVFDSDEGIAGQWHMLLPGLLGGDMFSTCSEYQRKALLGELGACGRLNRHTAGRDLVVVSPLPAMIDPVENQPRVARGVVVPEDAFIVLQSGGYNTWMDEKTLFLGLEHALARNPNIHFVSIGGPIPTHNEKTHEDFRRRVESSEFRARFHLLGWAPSELVSAHYAESDLGVCVDFFSVEGLLGSRTRVVEWCAAGLPAATTALSEVTEDLVRRELVSPVPFGDPVALGGIILDHAARPSHFRARADRARGHVLDAYSPERVVAPIAEWVDRAAPAPDLPPLRTRPGHHTPIHPDNTLGNFWAESLRNPLSFGLGTMEDRSLMRQMRRLLRRIRDSFRD